MEELVRIRKPKGALSSVRRTEEATQRRRADGAPPLVQVVEALGDGEKEGGSDSHVADQGTAASQAWPPNAPTGTQQRCALCRQNVARYNCPQCNVPYCSLLCFQSPRHMACARPFADRTLRQELGPSGRDDSDSDDAVLGRGSNGAQSAAHASQEERKQMMDVLRRLQTLGGDAGDPTAMDAEDGSEEGSEEEVDERHTDVDVDDATTDDLLRMLSFEERARFEAAVQDLGNGQQRAHALLDKLNSQGTSANGQRGASKDVTKGDERTPWWRASMSGESIGNDLSSFVTQVRAMQSAMPAKTAPLEWNVVAVLLAYVYAVRHFGNATLSRPHCQSTGASEVPHATNLTLDDEYADMPPLEPAGTPIPRSHYEDLPALSKAPARQLSQSKWQPSKEEAALSDETKLARHTVERMVPFLFADGRRKHSNAAPSIAKAAASAAQTVLSTAQEATLWTVSHLGEDCGPTPAKTLHFLFEDISSLLKESGVSAQDDDTVSPPSRLEQALGDLSVVLPKVAQRKLVFYTAVWARQTPAKRQDIHHEVDIELQRLAAEIERSEDEERWRAAHAALAQQDGIVLPQ